jgi:hypothetical protein
MAQKKCEIFKKQFLVATPKTWLNVNFKNHWTIVNVQMYTVRSGSKTSHPQYMQQLRGGGMWTQIAATVIQVVMVQQILVRKVVSTTWR